MAWQGLPWHFCGVFPKGWRCWLVFFEAAGHFLRVGRAGRGYFETKEDIPRAGGTGRSTL